MHTVLWPLHNIFCICTCICVCICICICIKTSEVDCTVTTLQCIWTKNKAGWSPSAVNLSLLESITCNCQSFGVHCSLHWSVVQLPKTEVAWSEVVCECCVVCFESLPLPRTDKLNLTALIQLAFVQAYKCPSDDQMSIWCPNVQQVSKSA